MLHNGTFNVKLIKNWLLLMVYFYWPNTNKGGGDVGKSITLANKGSEEPKIMLTLFMDSPLQSQLSHVL